MSSDERPNVEDTDRQATFKEAQRHHLAGRWDAAARLYGDILAASPGNPDVLQLLGVVELQRGNAEVGVRLIERAIDQAPDHADAHFNLGVAHRQRNDHAKAAGAYRRAIAARPEFAEAHGELALVCHAQGRLDDAEAAARRAIALDPGLALAHNALGIVLRDQGAGEAAMASFRASLAQDSHFAEAHNNLGVALRDRGDHAAAADAYRQALALKADFAEAHNNLGNALQELGRSDEAIATLRAALRVSPDYATAHHNLGIALLLAGQFEEGWDEYEWRWRVESFAADRARFRQPVWSGAPLDGETVLVHTEQGLGDTLQFIRYVPRVAAAGGRVVVECERGLARLVAAVDGVERIVLKDTPLPQHALRVPLLSLPRIAGTTLASVPAEVPYLKAPEGARRPALAPADGRRRVGIVWAGNPKHGKDRARSCPLGHFARLARRDDVALYSLQVGAQAAELASLDAPIDDLAPGLTDFADTAAALDALDLVITVDTAVAHLAGALARPVWTLLPVAPDWRWMLERDDSPWYPTMRLFRQASRGDWDGVFARVEAALNGLCGDGVVC